jgi:hypothetical protein
MTHIEQEIKSNIKKYGHHIIHVLEEEDEANFSYTIGLYETYKQPEIIIIGQSQDLLQVLLNNLAYDYKQGRVLTSGQLEEDILDDYKCMALDVDKKHYEEFLGLAMDYYKGIDFPVMQIIWPTQSNQYPYDTDAPEGFKKWQPVLGKVKKD